MAAYGKIKFSLESLKEKSLAIVDGKMDEVRQGLAVLQDDEMFEATLDQWREAQVENIRLFAATLSAEPYTISNEDIAAFKVEPMPQQDMALVARLEREYKRLESQRNSIIVKSGSLVPDEDGNVALTKTQLAENFGI